MGRAPCCEKIGLKRGRWTAEEDQILTNYIHTHGEGSWRSLPKNAGLLRCGKSCRLRWVNYLKSDLKRGKFSSDEDETIIKLHASLGNRWCLIAGHLPGRTDNEIKNYWNSHLSRQIYNFRKIIQQQLKQQPVLPVDHQLIKTKSGNKRRGRTSRSAMKKNKSYAASKLIHTTTTQAPMPNKGTETVPMPPTPTLQEDVTSSMLLDINEDMETIDDIFLGSPFSNLVIDELEVGPDHLQTLGDDDIQNWLVDANIIVDESKGEEDQVVEKSDEFIQTTYLNHQELDMRLDWDWDWDWGKLDIDDGFKGQEFWDSEEDKLLSWLRESTCEKGDEGDCSSSKFQTSETHSDKQNAIVEWLLS